MTYALGIASGGQSAEVRGPNSSRAGKKKSNVRSTSSNGARYKSREKAATRPDSVGTEALEEMFASSRTRFLAIAYSVLRNKEDAEDAVQTAFLSAYRHLRSFEGRSALGTWLTRIVLNAALMMRRKRRPSVVKSLSETGVSYDDNWTESIPDLQPDPEMAHAERETVRLIHEKLKMLTPRLRQAFTMTYYDELSGREASALLGVSSGAFKARLFHARQRLLNQTDRASIAPLRRRLSQHPVRATEVHFTGK